MIRSLEQSAVVLLILSRLGSVYVGLFTGNLYDTIKFWWFIIILETMC